MFSSSEGGYRTEFSKCKIHFNVKYEVICKILYIYLEVNNLIEIKVNE